MGKDKVEGLGQVSTGQEGAAPEMEAVPQPPGLGAQGGEQAGEGDAVMSVNDVGQEILDFFPGAVGDGPDDQEGQVMGPGNGSDGGGFQVHDRLGQTEDLGRQRSFGGEDWGGDQGSGAGGQAFCLEQRRQARGRCGG